MPSDTADAYGRLPSFVLGFHGCDRKVAADLVSGRRQPTVSQNQYDWLGTGIYFWENNPSRALTFARELVGKKRSGKETIKRPAVVGAVMDLGYCFNLLDAKFLRILRDGYEILKETFEEAGRALPANRPLRGSHELLLRDLDCAVINGVHAFRAAQNLPAFDTVRSAFIEGGELFPGSAIREKNHIQICVCNPSSIKGYFRPLADLD